VSHASRRRHTRFSRDWSSDVCSSDLRLGPPWFQLGEGSTVTMHPTWRAQNLTPGRVLLNDAIPIAARCHVRVVDDLRAALADTADRKRAVAGKGLDIAGRRATRSTHG